MAFIAGKGYLVKVNSADVSAWLTNVSFPLTKDALETTTMGDSARDYIEGLRNATVTLSGRWDGAVNDLDSDLYTAWNSGSTVTFALNPTGAPTSGTSNPFYTGSCHVTNYEHSAAFDGVVAFSATLQVSGAVTRNTGGTAWSSL